MTILRRALFPLVAAAALASLPSCGGVYGGGAGGSAADVRGNIEAVFPAGTGRDIVVFVYRVKDEAPDCTEPEFPERDDGSQNEKVDADQTDFDVRNVPAGRFVVVFLLDGEGHDADGRIDPGDPIAVLDDPDCVLDDVPNKYIVQLDNVRINFSATNQSGFPAPGRAEADDISEAPE